MDVLIMLIIGIILAIVIGSALRKMRSPDTASPEDPTPDGPGSRRVAAGQDRADIPSDPGESRPAGPGAEAMSAPKAGDPAPGDPQQDADAPDAVPPSEAGRKDLPDDS